MKILYTPISTLVASLTPEQNAEILAAAGKESVLVVAKTPELQREEIVEADVLFGRVSPETFTQAHRLRYYHCLGAGVDSSFTHAPHGSYRTITAAPSDRATALGLSARPASASRRAPRPAWLRRPA